MKKCSLTWLFTSFTTQIYEGMTHEYKEDRVMVFVNDAGKVVGSPIVG